MAVAACIPHWQLPGKLFDLLAVSGRTSGPVHAYVRAGVCERGFFAHTVSLSATSICRPAHPTCSVEAHDILPLALAESRRLLPTGKWHHGDVGPRAWDWKATPAALGVPSLLLRFETRLKAKELLRWQIDRSSGIGPMHRVESHTQAPPHKGLLLTWHLRVNWVVRRLELFAIRYRCSPKKGETSSAAVQKYLLQARLRKSDTSKWLMHGRYMHGRYRAADNR